MKQITLETQNRLAAPCAGRLLTVWALYGWSMLLVWHALARGPATDAAVWSLAVLSGLALAAWTREV
jgi:hypothetical protein